MKTKIVGIYSVIHFIVDLSCSILVSNLVTKKMGLDTNLFVAILTYNFFAFAMQLPIGIIAILLFNMTMPITLISLSNMFDNNKGLAFGLLTLALFVGAVPTFIGCNQLFTPIGLFTITLISSIILYIALIYYNKNFLKEEKQC